MVRCSGCHSDFTVSGYTLHVQRTKSSACIAAYHAQINDADNVDNMDAEVFSGDFFGDYEEDDFDWPDNDQEPADGKSPVPVHSMIYNVGPGSDDENEHGRVNEDFIDVVRPVNCAAAEETHFEIEPFPLATAGAPIPGSEHAPSSFETYRQSIGSNNNYAPFHSRLDWEMAQWVKMHGPSSSAISKLLETEGVCTNYFHSTF